MRYIEGPNAAEALLHDNPGDGDCETCARIELSPMQIVYIQTQVLALVEYATEHRRNAGVPCGASGGSGDCDTYECD